MAGTDEPAVPEDGPEQGGDGLRWSFEFDLESVLAEIGRPLSGSVDDDQEAILAAENEARDGGAASVDLAGLIAEHLPAGPGLAAWLAQQDPARFADRDLPSAAAAFRKVASWAQAAELSVVAQITARSAARDKKAGLEAGGRPAQVTRDAAAQVGLGLALSPCGASAWAELAVTLGWRLSRTGAALAEGTIDLYRARVVAEATAPLTDEAARKVEDKILPQAGDLTYGQLHAAVRRAVIAADPEGAEHRREAAERRARVSLYPDNDHTATLAGSRLSAVHAAAAMARLSAMARALKASGAGGGIDYLRAHVFLGLLMGTLPMIPPPTDAPPDNDPPPDNGDPHDDPPDNGDPYDGDPPGNGEPGDPDHATPPGDVPPDDTEPSSDESPGCGRPAGGGPAAAHLTARDAQPGRPRGRPYGTADLGAGPPGRTSPRPGWAGPSQPDPPIEDIEPWPDPPPLTDADAPADDGFRDTPPPFADPDEDGRSWGDPLEDPYASTNPVPALPPIPARSPDGGRVAPASAAGGAGPRQPGPGQLDLTLPWFTLTGASGNPGTLSRIGPVTAAQARHVAELAAAIDHPAQWRVILADARGHAITAARVPRHSGRAAGAWAAGARAAGAWAAGARAAGPRRSAQPAGLSGVPTAEPDPRDHDGAAVGGLVGRVTVTMPASAVTRAWAEDTGGGVLPAILRAARRAHAQALGQARADADAPGGCARATASEAYQPPPRIREYVTARDLTCRYPYCGQPAWRGDLDHTRPWHKGGRTCRCNLGPLCRAHHVLKQLAGWTLTQPQPGVFQWTTPAGCVYTTGPDRQLS